MDNAQVEVTQEDREVAETAWRLVSDDFNTWAALSDPEKRVMAQAFACHRIAAIAAIGPSEYERGATEERAKIVAWLRSLVNGYPESAGYAHAADAIEAGEHLATAISNMEPGK